MRWVFRFRYLLHFVLFALGFLAPWNYLLQLDPSGPSAHVWGTLAALLSRNFVLSIIQAFNLLLVVAIAFAVAGAALRTWGAAYLGTNIVKSGAMHTGADAGSNAIVADGPYRHLRNPLYLGTFLHTVALTLLMPVSGAVFTLVAVGGLQLVLIASEERYLSGQLGAAYQAYCALVPRLWPRLRARMQGGGLKPRWGQAFLGEIYLWGVAVAYAVAGWQYNAQILIRGVLISLGIGIVARALLPRPSRTAEQTA